MDSKPTDQSCDKTSPLSASSPETEAKPPAQSVALSAALRPRAPKLDTSTFPTESYSVTNPPEARANHVSRQLTEASSVSVSKKAPGSESSRGTLDRQVEHTSLTESALQEESERKETSIANGKDTSAAKKREEEEEMCMAEPNEQRSDKMEDEGKMYEIPLTILPKETTKPRKKQSKKGQTSGRWTHEEHQAFLEGLKVFGREWKKVADKIPTRNSAQIRSHAQKYFSKIAKDDALLMQEQQQQAPSQQEQQQMPASVQRTAERIMANPTGVQLEVEDTLRQLRERYRQLQIRLEQSQRARGLQPMDRIVEEHGEPDGGLPAGLIHRGGYAPGLDRRKRTLEEALQQNQDNDGASSVSSDLSQSLASLSPSREFGNEELIALHVLGGTLPRSASGTELHAHESRSPSFSEASEDPDAKRQRLEESNDHAGDGGNNKEEEHDQDGDEAMM